MPLMPVALYGLEVQCGDVLVPAVPDFPATFRITMAAIDPSEPAEVEETANGTTRPRATLKIVHQSISNDSEDDEDSEEYMRALLAESDSSDEEDSAEEEANGGPSDPSKTKKARKAAALQQLMDSLDTGSDDEMADAPNGTNGKADKKGKAKASSDDEDEDEDESDDGEDIDVEEFVLCTLDPEKNYQQPLDITIAENERVFFKVTGTHTVYLTGNYVMPDDDGHNRHHEVYDSDDEEGEEYDLSPDEDELELEMDDDESDDLDALEDPRFTEVDSDDEEAPKLIKATEKKGKNKRSADELDNTVASLDEMIGDSLKPEAAAGEEQKLSKKQLKKLKKNNGEAAAAKIEEPKKDDAKTEKADKKVQFAKNLELGPTGSAEKPKTAGATLGSKVIDGVKVDDKKLGSGPACKKGNVVGLRYIGKLEDGKVFDSNKKGQPFSFKVGSGEVIKGWDIGVAGMSIGGERRITIPPHLAYGKKSIPKIPGNSTLIFDLKLLEIK